MKTFCLLLCLLLFLNSACASTSKIEIEAKDQESLQAKKVLESLILKHDLSQYIFTEKIVIEKNVIPHSHPVLTLKAEESKNPDSFLGTFIHEQMHWYWIQNSPGIDIGPRVDFKEKYPDVPKRLPEGARGSRSTYQHIGICWLEYQGLKAFIGKKRAREVMLNKPYYTWVYQTIVSDENWIGEIMGKYSMAGPTAN